MAWERDIFWSSGPLHLTAVDWDNAKHQRTVVACLVEGVYLLEQDRQKKRQGSEAFAPPWWEFFHFKLLYQLVDDADKSIFGAVYEFDDQTISRSPRYVIAFRGNLIKRHTFCRDIKLDLHLILNKLHKKSRSKIAMQSVWNMVASVGDSDIWLAGHSLGSAMAMLAGKTTAKNGHFLKTFLFNPPFISISIPVERIKNKKVKKALRTAGNWIIAGLAIAIKQSEDPFMGLSRWIPSVFVNPKDPICSGYIEYFEHRENMEKNGAGVIGRLATQNSIGGLLLNTFGKETDPLHLIPSANLIVNRTPSQGFQQSHGIRQWWQPDLQLQSKLIKY